jgi:hypothetical protein
MSYGNTVLADTPTMYWRLNETTSTFADSSGNAHPATYSAGTQGSTALNSDTGAASVLLAGTGIIATLAYAAAIPQTGPFTIDCLVQFTALPSGASYHFICNGPAHAGWGAGIQDIDKGLYTLFGVADNFSTGWPLMSTGTTYHMAWVIDTTPQVLFYLNGTAYGTSSLGAEISNTTDGISLGAGNAGSDALKGYLSDVAIYPSALSAARVLAHYNAIGSGGTVGPSSATTFSVSDPTMSRLVGIH